MSEEFISESITPVAGSFKTAAMTRGEPALPAGFVWKDRKYEVAEVIEAWKETGPCRSGGGEQYLRKHWYKITTGEGLRMTIYFERQPRSKSRSPARDASRRKARWWLYTIEHPEGS